MSSATEDVVGGVEKDGMRSKSVDSRGSSISSEVDSEAQKGARRRSKESTISEERPVSERISKAIEEEDAFLVYIKSLPAMSSDKVEAYKKSQSLVYKRSTSEVSGGLEHLDNLYRLMEHLGQLRLQNNKLQERVKYLEHIAQEDAYVPHKIEHETEVEDVKNSRNKRSTKCKSSHYGIRHPFLKSARERSRSVGVEEITKSTGHYRILGTHDFDLRGPGSIKAKVSKWTKVKEAFRWEKASNGVLPEAKSQDSGLGATDDVRYLRVPHAPSDHSSSFSVSPADSVLSGQSLGQPKDCLGMPHISSSASTSDEDIEDTHFAVDSDIPTCSFRREGIDPRRSKSLDGVPHSVPCEIQDNNESGKDHKNSHPSQKGVKTPWNKMKDIIQTRTVSTKKKKEDSDLEEDVSTGIIPEDGCYDHSLQDFERSTESPTVEGEVVDTPGKGYDRTSKRRLAPMLTITLPSTEELHRGPEPRVPPTKVAAKPPPSPQTDERHLKASVKSRCHEESLSLTDSVAQQGPRKISGGSAGTSPPTHRKLSKWSKVKNAFLTSASTSEDCLMRGSSSVPSSPVKATSFTYDIESDELSSGEFIDDNIRDDDVFPETIDDICDLTKHQTVHAEIQRNYEELQLKLSQEFHKKLCEWERKKSAGSASTPPCTSKVAGSGLSSGTSSIGDDSTHDKIFRKKMEEWEKMKSLSSVAKHRESVTLQNLSEDNLSAEFKKKLEEWEKIKSVPSPQTPDIVSSPQQPFKKKITDWQLWKPGVITSRSEAGISGMASPPAELPEDFYKKLQEWERLKQYGAHPGSDTPDNKTPSPNTSRRDCNEHKAGKAQHSPTGKKERDFGFQIRVQKSKSHHEVKELAWLEKELHKIEREKLRLERERDKYLEREARLEKLRKAIGANIKKQEIVIPTSTGLFRFEGISQKFTRKLYEWEKARGIGPEASTFALLEPGYQPPRPSSDIHGQESNGSLLTRSKSMGSVVDLAALVGNQNTLTHQPSSLSLTHMEQLENSCALRDSNELCIDEPQAMIVDVVDEIEETASPLEHTPAVESQTPIYCYAPEEVTRLIDSSGSDSDKDVNRLGRAQSSIDLVHENMQLLDSLQRKEDICRELVRKVDDVEDKLNEAEKVHKEHLGNFVKASYEDFSETSSVQRQSKEEIKEELLELELQQERLIDEGTTLQNSFVEHSEQQARITQDLVHNVKRLQDYLTTIKMSDQDLVDLSGLSQQFDKSCQIKELTSELLSLAEKLEVAVSERNQELSLLRRVVGVSHGSRGRGLLKLRASRHWFSSDSVSSIEATEPLVSHTSGDFSLMPLLLTRKLQDLKKLLNTLITDTEMKTQTQSGSKTKFNIINPESPEVETTFVFNIGKKNKNQTAINQFCNSEIGKHENTNNEDFINDSSSADASFTFSQARSSFSGASHTCTVQSDQVLASQSIMKSNYERVSLEEDHEKLKKNSIESVVELTYPIKTYFSEEFTEPRLRRASDRNSKVSSGSDSESSISQKLKHSDDAERSGYENTREITATRKHKRNRLSSGLLERRRSRTSSKDENTDEEEENERLYEPSTSKKSVNYDTRYKKQSKSKYKSNECAGKKGQKDGCEVISTNSSIDPVENSVEESVGIIKPLSSPKCTSKRLKKVSKSSKDDSSWNGASCTTYKYYCKGQTGEVLSNQGMAVNVFVPTTRKIFSPVRKDSKDETSTVISYVVQEPDPSCVTAFERSDSNTYGGDDTEKNENNGESASCKIIDKGESKELDSSNIQLNEKKEQPKPTFDFVMPPCWIIKQARAQSASPALQRKTVTKSGSKDSIPEKRISHKIIDGQRENVHKLKTQNNGDESKEVSLNNTRAVKENELDPCHSDKQSSTDLFTSKDNSKKNSSSSESVENSRLLRKEGSSIPSSLKLRSEAGFPPISPLSVRREMKVMKETAPSIRMMIAKYNQRVHETLEQSGTKSPDSGAQSPIAWRSPVTERRINAQMEKYQEEVRRAFQNNSKKEFYPHAKLGQVQKSASAGYIRPFEKGCSNDSINSKGEDKSFEQSLQSHGILKSSSAGAIKTVSPLPIKRQDTNGVDINVLVSSPSTALNNRKEIKPIRFEIRSGESISQAIRVSVSSVVTDSKRATAVDNHTVNQIPDHRPNTLNLQQDNTNSSTKVRALKIKKAKEEFLLRGCVGEASCVDQTGTPNCPSTPETHIHNERLLWEGSKTRLSQISCDSESSYENVPMILVSGRELPRDSDGVLLVKSASVGMINMDSTACSSLFCGTSNSPESHDQGAVPKTNKSGILSRFRRARLKKNRGKEHKLETVSTLCMQSLVVDINKNNQASSESIPSTSKSCPSSPVLHKKDQSASSWIRNPKRIFKPKQ